MQIAHEMDSACDHHAAALERLLRRVPLEVADILDVTLLLAMMLPQYGVSTLLRQAEHFAVGPEITITCELTKASITLFSSRIQLQGTY